MADGGLEGVDVEGGPTVDEAEPRKVAPTPDTPTASQRAAHEVTHIPIAVGVITALRLSAESEDTLLMDMMEVVGYR